MAQKDKGPKDNFPKPIVVSMSICDQIIRDEITKKLVTDTH